MRSGGLVYNAYLFIIFSYIRALRIIKRVHVGDHLRLPYVTSGANSGPLFIPKYVTLPYCDLYAIMRILDARGETIQSSPFSWKTTRWVRHDSVLVITSPLFLRAAHLPKSTANLAQSRPLLWRQFVHYIL